MHLRQMPSFPSGVCFLEDKSVFLCVVMCVSDRGNCLRKYVCAYLFNLAHMLTLLNLDVRTTVLLLLDDRRPVSSDGTLLISS